MNNTRSGRSGAGRPRADEDVRPTLFVALLLIAALPCAAGDFFHSYFTWRTGKSEVSVREVEGIERHISEGKLRLHLHDFLELVLKNSADIQITRMDVYTATDRITAAKAPFDPSVALGFTAARSLTPPFYYSQDTLNNLSQQSSAVYNQLLPTGQTVSTNFGVSRFSGASYTAPLLFGNLSFSVTQPLLRNRKNIEYRAPLTIARTQLNVTSELSEAAIGVSVADAARQYWLAVLARDSIKVQEQTLALAQKSYERDQKALDLGAIAKLDIYQSETQVAERTRDLIQARYQYTAALDGLRRLIGADLTAALRSTEIVLEDDAAAPLKSEILPFEEALAKAMQARPEMKAAGARIAIDDLNAHVSRESFLPKLDLTLNGGASGPSANFGASGTVYPGLTDTLRQVLGFNYPSYGLGLQMTIPFRNSTGQANLVDALVSKTRNVYQQRQTQEQIILEVRQAINAIELAKATIDAAIRARDLAKKNVDAEQQKYELGTITAFELLDSQSRLAATENALLSAYVTYQQAYVSYQRATWSLLDGLGIVVEKPKVR
jgi:outer membrane protein TolC